MTKSKNFNNWFKNCKKLILIVIKIKMKEQIKRTSTVFLRKLAEELKNKKSRNFSQTIVTMILPAKEFYKAEKYH